MSFPVQIGNPRGIRHNMATPLRFFISIVDLLRRRKLVYCASNAFSAARRLFYLTGFVRPVQLLRASAQRRRAIAQLSRMDQRELKDLGFPTPSQVECRYFWSW